MLGSINLDLAITVEQLPAPGATVLGAGLRRSLGGKGANQALAAARAGAQVAMIGRVGRGDGDDAVRRLELGGVDVSAVRRVDAPTGLALITVDADGENTIVVHPGANAEWPELDQREAAVIAGADLLVVQLELPMDLVLAGAETAAAAGVPVLLNPSPIRPLPDRLRAAVAIIVVNEGEAAAVVAGPGLRVVTTLGARGARYAGPDGAVAVPAPAVRVIDTTGAGDAFTGAFAAAWARGDDPAAALTAGCAAGAEATTRFGAG